MRSRFVFVAIAVILSGLTPFLTAHAATAFGFGVGVPAVTPIDWSKSFPFISVEAFTDSNLSLLFVLGTYPADFPTGFATSGSLLAKGWIGPLSLYGGGGLSVSWRYLPASAAWDWSPALDLIAGVQWQVAAPLALSFQVRSLDPLPLTFTLHPEVSLGASLVLGPAASHAGPIDGTTLWIIVGLGVFVFLAYYSH